MEIMCKASKYVNEIDRIIRQIQSDRSKLGSKLSEYDKEISRIYHKIETMKFNACEGYYLSKELQTVLHKRRLVKNEGDKLKSLLQSLGALSNVKNAKNNVNKLIKKHKDYTYEFGISFDDIKDEIFH